MNKKTRVITILLLGALMAIIPFSIDMYLPSFPDIAVSLGTPVTTVSLSLSSFFIGIGIGELLYGPLLDRYGRKKPLYFGLLLYTFASIGCASASSIETLIIFRFIQAIGGCSGTIVAIALVRDLFPPEKNAKIHSILILILSISPLLAPTLGGYVGTKLGWSSIFILLTFLIFILLLGAFFYLPEGKKEDKNFSLSLSSIVKSYGVIMHQTNFIIYASVGAVSFASLFTYIASSPGVFIESFDLTQKQYGLLFAFLASGLTAASQLNTVFLKRFESQRIILFGLIFQSGFGLMLLILSIPGLSNLWVIIALLFLYLSTLGLIIPNASALAMKPFQNNAGSASALLGFFQMGLGSLATILIGLLKIHTMLPMVLMLMVSSLLGLTLVAWSAKFKYNIGDTILVETNPAEMTTDKF